MSSSEQQDLYISLANFDPGSRQLIDSPRSLQAIYKLGIEQSDLFQVSKEQVLASGVPMEFKDDLDFFVTVKMEHLEKKRVELVKLALQQREKSQEDLSVNQIIQNRNTALVSKEDMLKDQQNKKIQKIQMIHKNELDKIIKTELQLSHIEKKRRDKEEKIEQLQRKKEEEQRQLKMRNQEIQSAREQKLQDVESKRSQDQLNALGRMEKMQSRWEQKQSQMKEERERRLRENEAKRVEKVWLLQQNLENQEQSKMSQRYEKKRQYDRKMENIEKKTSQRQQSLQQKNQESYQRTQERLNGCYQSQEEEKERSYQRMQMKQKSLEQRFRSQEQMKNDEKFEKYQQVEQKKLYLEQKMQEMQEQKYMEYMKRQQKNNVHFQKYLNYKSDYDGQRQSKIFENHHRQQRAMEKTKQLLIMTQLENDQKIQDIQSDMEKAEQIKSCHLLETRRKYILKHLNIEDALKNQKRLAKQSDGHKQRIMMKIQLSEEKINYFKQEQEDMRNQRQIVEKRLNEEKFKILMEFQQKKKEAIEKNDLSILSNTFQNDTKTTFNHSYYTPKKPITTRVQMLSQQKSSHYTSLPQIEQEQQQVQVVQPEKNRAASHNKKRSYFNSESSSNQNHNSQSKKESTNQSIAQPILRPFYVKSYKAQSLQEKTQEAIKIYISERSVIQKKSEQLEQRMEKEKQPERERQQATLETTDSQTLYRSRLKFIKSIYTKQSIKILKRMHRIYNNDIMGLLKVEIIPSIDLDDPNVLSNLSYRLLNLYRKQEINLIKMYRSSNHLSIYDDYQQI